MKRVLITSILLITFLLSTVPGYCFKNEPDGFFSDKWGASLDSFNKKYDKLTLIKDEGGVKWYKIDGGYKMFAGVLGSMTYQFFNEELFYVNIYYQDGYDGRLKKALIFSYGEPTRKRDAGVSEWSGGEMGIVLDEIKNSISFWSKAVLYKKKLAALQEKDKAKKAAAEKKKAGKKK